MVQNNEDELRTERVQPDAYITDNTLNCTSRDSVYKDCIEVKCQAGPLHI